MRTKTGRSSTNSLLKTNHPRHLQNNQGHEQSNSSQQQVIFVGSDSCPCLCWSAAVCVPTQHHTATTYIPRLHDTCPSVRVCKRFSYFVYCNFYSGVVLLWGETPESGIPPIYRATRRYTNVHLGFCLRFSTLIGQIGRLPLFGAGPRRYIRPRLFRLAVTTFWRAFTAFWRQKGERKQIFPRAVRTTELPSNPSP